MKKPMKVDGRLVKIVGSILQSAHDLAEWGLETKQLTEDDLRQIVIKRDPVLRRQAATKLIESGMSRRQAAGLMQVPESTLRETHLRESRAGNARKSRTGSAKVKAHRTATSAKAASGGVTPEPTDKYRILYADPPWDYGAHAQPDYQTEQRDHYAVMPLEDICALPVEDWVEDDAVLFLWVTSPMLEKSFKVVNSWGFEYKAAFIWDKIKHNMGHYNSVRHELLLVCTRGSCQPDVKTLQDSVQSIERSDKHSQKPVEFYDIIETNYTHGKRLEMFSRQQRVGWDAYAHQAELKEAAE